ncbi:unnamed protein product [Brachionus calyciflorus]|uniref:SAND domain-containing protein n=1 Tax=Brachionus calyciflorus TaxID=104777 RepID=A0A813WFN8_9BILA|nr:unnamed protein product [Brachionus calyciflorus]
MVTTFNSNSKLKSKLETLTQLPANYINYNNLLVNSNILNDEVDEEYEEDDEPLHDQDDENNNRPITYSTRKNPTKHFNFDKKILYEDIIQVNCNSIVAELHKKRFGSGGKGRCIRVMVDSNDGEKVEKWMTPIEFETYCGKGNCRDWKRTLKAGGQQILAVLDAGILTCHAVSCSCAVCNQNESLVGPIKPFMRYRRRKKDEILAQNAYKKFLSLKPPTLLGDISFNSSQNSTSPVQKILPSPSLRINSSSNQSLSKANSLSINTQINSNNNGNNNNNNSKDDLIRFINKMQENDDKKWASLEQMTQEMINQVKNLQSQIEIQRKESEVNRKLLIEKLLHSQNNQPNSYMSTSSSSSSITQSTRKRKLSSTQHYNYEYNYDDNDEYADNDECYQDEEDEDVNFNNNNNNQEQIGTNNNNEYSEQQQNLEHVTTDEEDFFKEKNMQYY